MRYLTISIIIIFITLIIACGGSEMEQGDKNFSEGNYTLALNHYIKYKKDNPGDSVINRKLALTYMHKGKKLFDKTGNIKTFSGNYDKSRQYITEPVKDRTFNRAYSAMLKELAIAYRKARTENEIQKEQYFTSTLDFLNSALEFDPDNNSADSLLQAIYDSNFQKMYDKGITLYKQALKQKNIDLYISAENYLTQANRFRPDDKNTQKYLSKVRRKTLSILRNTTPFSFCVVGFKKDKNAFLTDITIANFTGKKMIFDPGKFNIELSNGEFITYDATQTAQYEKGLTGEMELEPRSPRDGVLAFTIPAGERVIAMNYQDDNGTSVTKYFP